jgi:hypothetical protein
MASNVASAISRSRSGSTISMRLCEVIRLDAAGALSHAITAGVNVTASSAPSRGVYRCRAANWMEERVASPTDVPELPSRCLTYLFPYVHKAYSASFSVADESSGLRSVAPGYAKRSSPLLE